MTGYHLVSITVFLPLLGALLLSVLPSHEKGILKNFAFVFSLVPLGLGLVLFSRFDMAEAGFQFLEKGNWIIGGISYIVGVDGISVLMVVLTVFITPITILSAYNSIKHRQKQFLISLLLLETGMLGAFVALDLFLFYLSGNSC